MKIYKNQMSIIEVTGSVKEVKAVSKLIPKGYAGVVINFSVRVESNSFWGTIVRMDDREFTRQEMNAFIRRFKMDYKSVSNKNKGTYIFSDRVVEKYGIRVKKIPLKGTYIFSDRVVEKYGIRVKKIPLKYTVTIVKPYELVVRNTDKQNLIQLEPKK